MYVYQLLADVFVFQPEDIVTPPAAAASTASYLHNWVLLEPLPDYT